MLRRAWQGSGSCARLLASGKTCARDFCPECAFNEYCNKACGFCESAADETVDCDTTKDPSCGDVSAECSDDEEARAAADPFRNELSPFTQGCSEIAEGDYCEDESYIKLGVLDFCCSACRIAAGERAVEHKCDFMAIVNSCQDPTAMASMQSQDVSRICDNACSQALIANYDVCMKDPTDGVDTMELASLEPIVTGCRDVAPGAGH